jgi:hypothetical protein
MRNVALAAAVVLAAVSADAAPSVTPACANPAPYASHHTCAIVRTWTYLVGVTGDPAQTTHALEQQYGFRAQTILESINYFIANLSPQQVALLRCDARVFIVEENSVIDGNPELDGACAPADVPLFTTPALVALAALFAVAGVIIQKR